MTRLQEQPTQEAAAVEHLLTLIQVVQMAVRD
jgi:hypothetical protein